MESRFRYQLFVGLLILFLVLFFGLFAYFVAQGADRQHEGFADRSSYAAKVVSAHTFWISEVAIQTLRLVDAALGEAMLNEPDKLRLLLDDLPAGTEIYVVNAAAALVYSTVA